MHPSKRPKMILFDYGHTLLYEPGFDTLRGQEAVCRHITHNPRGYTARQINEISLGLFSAVGEARNLGVEIHEWQFQQLLYETLEIKLALTPVEVEQVFWDNASYGARMPFVAEMLDYITTQGIRRGVVSNISFSGATLSARIARLLPDHTFEFILASSEYVFRKPNALLFDLALKKAGLAAEEVWFCGDTIEADIDGAAGVGMFPVWYEDQTADSPWKYHSEGRRPSCDHLHIHDWRELIAVLEELPAR